MRLTKETILAATSGMDLASVTWTKSELSQVHIAAIIKRGKVLAVSTNAIGTRTKGCGYDNRSIHAERAVIKKVGDNNALNGAILVVYRIARGSKKIVNSEPCHNCKRHLNKCIEEYGLKSVYYST